MQESSSLRALLTDSARESVRRSVMTATVPMSEVRLTLNPDSLRRLPQGAAYHARSGQASVSVGKGSDPQTIVVYASCDSLQRQVTLYEERLSRLSRQRADSTATVRTASEAHSNRFPIIALAAGVALGIVLTIITNTIWKILT